ncbi:hypothetical protein [Pasteurella sp. PK-2025]|uniref:hypothetical protein n=1 Tax=Pasteurella sp. PK-2025 TaxID=3413133 RepID=UPI003C71BD70
MITVNIRLFLYDNSEKAKSKIIKKLSSVLNNYSITVDDINIQIIFNTKSWELQIYEILKICNLLGREWNLYGNIEETFEAWSNSPKLVGVQSLHVYCDNPVIYNETYYAYINNLS